MLSVLALAADIFIVAYAVLLLVLSVRSYRRLKAEEQRAEEAMDFIREKLSAVVDGAQAECCSEGGDCACKSPSGVTPWYVELGEDGHD